jgi:hypothetical protein
MYVCITNTKHAQLKSEYFAYSSGKCSGSFPHIQGGTRWRSRHAGPSCNASSNG